MSKLALVIVVVLQRSKMLKSLYLPRSVLLVIVLAGSLGSLKRFLKIFGELENKRISSHPRPLRKLALCPIQKSIGLVKVNDVRGFEKLSVLFQGELSEMSFIPLPP